MRLHKQSEEDAGERKLRTDGNVNLARNNHERYSASHEEDGRSGGENRNQLVSLEKTRRKHGEQKQQGQEA